MYPAGENAEPCKPPWWFSDKKSFYKKVLFSVKRRSVFFSSAWISCLLKQKCRTTKNQTYCESFTGSDMLDASLKNSCTFSQSATDRLSLCFMLSSGLQQIFEYSLHLNDFWYSRINIRLRDLRIFVKACSNQAFTPSLSVFPSPSLSLSPFTCTVHVFCSELTYYSSYFFLFW